MRATREVRAYLSDRDNVDERSIIFEPIERGGMSHCFRVRVDHKSYFLKILHTRLLKNPIFHARFKQEIEIMRVMDGRGVVDIIQYTPSEIPWYLSKFVDALKIKSPIHQFSSIVSKRFIKALAEVVDTLELANSLGIVHRDLSPTNILVSDNYKSYVVDWGLAFWKVGDQHVGSRLTETWRHHGTSPFMPPEQWRALGDLPDQRNDLYSFSMCLLSLYFPRLFASEGLKQASPTERTKRIRWAVTVSHQMNPKLSESLRQLYPYISADKAQRCTDIVKLKAVLRSL